MCVAAPSVALAGLFGPSNYDECILENMKGVGDKYAAGAIMRACRSKFPEKKTIKPAVGESSAPAREGAGSDANAPQAGTATGRFTDFRPDDPHLAK